MTTSARDIESRALSLIKECGLERGPVPLNVIALNLGAKLSYEELESDVSGVLIVKGKEKHVLINKDHSVKRQRFTIGHEFGHLVLHDMSNGRLIVDTDIRVYQRVGDANSSVYNQSGSMTTPQEEREANAFSAALLMPEPWLRAAASAHEVDEDFVPTLAAEFDVSEQALFIRLQQLNIIESNIFHDLSRGGRRQKALFAEL